MNEAARQEGHQMHRSNGFRAVFVAILLGAVLVDCSNDSTTPSTSSNPPASTPATSTSTASGKDTLQQGVNDQLVFTPADISVKHGATLTVTNASVSTTHTFTVTGMDIDITNEGGQSQQVTIDLPPGTYPFVCTIHEAEGMKGTLTVT
jgi:plastocyanin